MLDARDVEDELRVRRFWEGVERGAERDLAERWKKIREAKARVRREEQEKGRRDRGAAGGGDRPPKKT